VGFEPACWNSALIRVLIWREFGVLSNRHYVCTLLHNMGVSFQKARFVSDHLDAARRQAWLRDEWPTILRAAQRRKGLLLFEDEASFAPWGSLSYAWARRGHQPEVPTSGKRKGYKVFGAIDYFSGRLFSQGIAGRFNSESYQAFWQTIMGQTTAHLFLIHDGARYHTSQATQQFFAAHASSRATHGGVPRGADTASHGVVGPANVNKDRHDDASSAGNAELEARTATWRYPL
jgi:hypothetical protein